MRQVWASLVRLAHRTPGPLATPPSPRCVLLTNASLHSISITHALRGGGYRGGDTGHAHTDHQAYWRSLLRCWVGLGLGLGVGSRWSARAQVMQNRAGYATGCSVGKERKGKREREREKERKRERGEPSARVSCVSCASEESGAWYMEIRPPGRRRARTERRTGNRNRELGMWEVRRRPQSSERERERETNAIRVGTHRWSVTCRTAAAWSWRTPSVPTDAVCLP